MAGSCSVENLTIKRAFQSVQVGWEENSSKQTKEAGESHTVNNGTDDLMNLALLRSIAGGMASSETS